MQVAKTIVRTAASAVLVQEPKEKEAIILYEIGLQDIPTATSFVEYVAELSGCSQSGIWYTLKRLKEKGLVDFTERGRGEENKPLSLTEHGREFIRRRAMEPERKAPSLHKVSMQAEYRRPVF